MVVAAIVDSMRNVFLAPSWRAIVDSDGLCRENRKLMTDGFSEVLLTYFITFRKVGR